MKVVDSFLTMYLIWYLISVLLAHTGSPAVVGVIPHHHQQKKKSAHVCEEPTVIKLKSLVTKISCRSTLSISAEISPRNVLLHFKANAATTLTSTIVDPKLKSPVQT